MELSDSVVFVYLFSDLFDLCKHFRLVNNNLERLLISEYSCFPFTNTQVWDFNNLCDNVVLNLSAPQPINQLSKQKRSNP